MTVKIATAQEIPLIDQDGPYRNDHEMLRACVGPAPVARTPYGTYLALRWRHAETLTNPSLTRQLELETMFLQGISDGPIFEMFANGMLFSNGEAHRRRRGPVAKTFAFKAMEAMRGEIRALAETLVRARLNAGVVDFLDEIAGEIPAAIIARILGVPGDDAPYFSRLVYSSIRGLSPHEPSVRPQIERDLAALNDYVAGLLEARRAAPEEDFLSQFLAATGGEGGLSPVEARVQVAGLILAGSDTTRLAICSTLSQLLQHQDQWAALCADPDGLKKPAAEEGLRYDPAVASVPRVALRNLDLDGFVVPAGSVVALSLIAALRDPEVYEDPDRFDIFRKDRTRWHLAFGAGAHRCLGEALARAELEETIAAIARLAPGTKLVGPPPKLSGLRAVRSIDRMEVAFAQRTISI
ncbi:cytochrome P450 [Amphiplicatus metriothermophilus]|uniref:Cytochrome P450 n=1 Tax=Amphiplicatus metriothermophilus TaxID=1519374 RepID=A0A239PJS9_9PROT|nr:cytochrome P450 [Amphiplicatus metriothermophilus]MBB5517604.1 hypothetical protein [Amphiplicatus metriothermophilus]SNT68062.1 hypothetical protein SAMN06297382_0558 [Amphiplicatus metriothermophilus]